MKKIYYLYIILYITMIPLFARLGDGIEIKGIKIDAKAEFTIGYDDNILLERDDEIDDMFFNIRPYADLEVPFSPETRFYISYDADIYRFFDISDEDSTSQVFLAGFDFEIQNLYGVLLEEYVLPQDRDGILYTNRIERSNNIPSLLLGFDFNRIAIEGIYKKTIARYKDAEYDRDEYDEDNFSLSAYFHAFTKTDFLLEANYSDLEYLIEGRDGDYFQIRAGIKGQITSKIQGTIKAGYQKREYYDSTETYDEPVFEIDTLCTFSEQKTLDIKYLKSAKESLIFGNNFYKLNRVSLEFRMNSPVRGILLGTGGFYENDKFPFTNNSSLRDDDVFQFFIRCGFRFSKGLSFEAKYRYLDRDSNYDAQDYTQNVITAYVNIML